MTARKIPIIATIIVAAAIATMVWLGFWQLDRLEQKEALIARYQASLTQSEPLAAFPVYNEEANLYRKATISCREVINWNAIAGRNRDDELGYVHIAGCVSGEIFAFDAPPHFVDVVIGWSRDPSLQPDWQGGAVTGTIAPSADAGWRIIADPPLAGLQANAVPDPASIPNNHFAYAIQWFLFAITALVIYILALRRRAR